MQVILLDKVANLGSLGDQVNVKAGYARNFLVPQGKAVPATKKNIEFFEARRAELEAKLAEVLAAANARAEKINALETVTIASKAGDEGKLFGSIGTRDIADAVTAAGVEVAKSEVRLPNGVLRTTGEHEVSFQVHSEVFAKVIVNVVRYCRRPLKLADARLRRAHLHQRDLSHYGQSAVCSRGESDRLLLAHI